MEILVAQRLKELMTKHGLNQVQLAEKVGLKQNSISAWLLGKNRA